MRHTAGHCRLPGVHCSGQDGGGGPLGGVRYSRRRAGVGRPGSVVSSPPQNGHHILSPGCNDMCRHLLQTRNATKGPAAGQSVASACCEEPGHAKQICAHVLGRIAGQVSHVSRRAVWSEITHEGLFSLFEQRVDVGLECSKGHGGCLGRA